jgi:hypothetical protein
MEEMRRVASGCGPLSSAAALRYERGRQRVNREPDFDTEELAEELAGLMA